MDDIQRAIETLKEMKLFYNPFNKNGEIDTAISAMQELQQYREIGGTVDKMYLEKCREVNALQERIRELESALTENEHVLAPDWQNQIMSKFTERR